MYSGLTNDSLYTAVKLELMFSNGIESDNKKVAGTGFFIGGLSEPTLVTNRHVVEIGYPSGKYPHHKISNLRLIFRGKDDKGMPSTVHNLTVINYKIHFHDQFVNDVCLITEIGYLDSSSLGITDIRVDYSLPCDLIATSDEFENGFNVGDWVAFCGYPEWHDKIDIRPLMRMGTIASDPRYSYSINAISRECVAYEAFSFGGSSGSPVFALQRGFTGQIKSRSFRRTCLMGINGGHLKVFSDESKTDAGAHSGLSYMYKATIIQEILDDVLKSKIKRKQIY